MSSEIIDRAREVFDIEMEGLALVRDGLGDGFRSLVEACRDILDGGGRIVLSGVGKSGYIGRKIAATLASTGSASLFMHPVEALHGDLGMLGVGDMLLTLSYSGETEELLSVLPAAKRFGVPVAAITGDSSSRLAEYADIIVEMPVHREACPFNLAPTTTTTAMLALGDALALTLLDSRGFTKEDYGRLHPGGAIGRSVTMTAGDIMRKDDKIVLVKADDLIKDVLPLMTRARCGSAVVVGDSGALAGVFTDGDFRRHVAEDLSILEKPVGTVMTVNPVSVRERDLAVEILCLVEKRQIDDIVVLDADDRVVGLVDVQDLPGLKLM